MDTTTVNRFETTGFFERVITALEISFTGKMQRIAIIIALVYSVLQPLFGILFIKALEFNTSAIIVIFITMVLSNIIVGLLCNVVVILQLSNIESESELELTSELIVSRAWGYFMTYMATWRYFMPPLLLMLFGSLCLLVGILIMSPDTAYLISAFNLSSIANEGTLGIFMVLGPIGIFLGMLWFIYVSYSVIFCGIAHVRNELEYVESIDYSVWATKGRKLRIFGNILFSGFLFYMIAGATGGMLTGIIGGNTAQDEKTYAIIGKLLPEGMKDEYFRSVGLDSSKLDNVDTVNIQSILSDAVTGIINGLTSLVVITFFYLLFVRTEQEALVEKNKEEGEGEDDGEKNT